MSCSQKAPIGWLHNERVKANLALKFDGCYKFANAEIRFRNPDAIPKQYQVIVEGESVCVPRIFRSIEAAIEYASSRQPKPQYIPQPGDKRRAGASIPESKYESVETVEEWIARTQGTPVDLEAGKVPKESKRKNTSQVFEDWMSDQTTGDNGGVSEYSLTEKSRLMDEVNKILNE